MRKEAKQREAEVEGEPRTLRECPELEISLDVAGAQWKMFRFWSNRRARPLQPTRAQAPTHLLKIPSLDARERWGPGRQAGAWTESGWVRN